VNTQNGVDIKSIFLSWTSIRLLSVAGWRENVRRIMQLIQKIWVEQAKLIVFNANYVVAGSGSIWKLTSTLTTAVGRCADEELGASSQSRLVIAILF